MDIIYQLRHIQQDAVLALIRALNAPHILLALSVRMDIN